MSLDVPRRFQGPQDLHLLESRSAGGTPEDGRSMILRNVGEAQTERPCVTSLKTRSSTKRLRKPRTSQFMQCRQHRPKECPFVRFTSVYFTSKSNMEYRNACLRDVFLTCRSACCPLPMNLQQRKPEMQADALHVFTCGVDYCCRPIGMLT